MLKLFTSNQQEHLVNALGDVLQQSHLPPLQKEVIVVQSQGMARWLALQLAQRLGIAANFLFPFPVHFTWEIFRRVLNDIPEHSAYQPDAMAWTLMRLLQPAQGLLSQPSFQPLQNYLKDDDSGVKRYQLAQRIAGLFDQYIVYRPEMILAWERGEDEAVKNSENSWQAQLWRRLHHEISQITPKQSHRAHLQQQFLTKIHQGTVNTRYLPKRIAIFGISALPPFYTEVFASLGQIIDVNLFVMNPCQEYWGDIIADNDIARQSLAHQQPVDYAEQHYLSSGNPLLASMGKLGRDFIDSLNDYDPVSAELFNPIEPKQALGAIQHAILNLRDDEQKINLSPQDASLQIHSCHSPLREIEVLHDRLLDLFNQNADLCPSDILVMAPDIATYTPLIQAVFDNQQAQKIPFRIVDRHWQGESQVVDTLWSILALVDSRLHLNDVLEILQREPVQQRFNLSDLQLSQLQHWLSKAGIRWGLDAQSRLDLDLPDFNQNSWDFGLSRLLLGYVWADASQSGNDLFNGIAPLDMIEGQQDSLLFATVLDYCQQLFKTCQQLQQQHSLVEWQALLLKLLDDFFPQDSEDNSTVIELQTLRQLFSKLDQQAQLSQINAPISLPVVRQWLQQNLNVDLIPQGFLSGHLTFCAMLPMRSIPFKAIMLLGMNDRIYPRAQKNLRFDLMANKPRRGDRSRRNDDRYLFLESLLSARDYFYISYIGQSIQDNSESPPSVLVGELLDYLQEHFNVDHDLIIKHRLHPFNQAYFNQQNAQLFSYAQDYSQLSHISQSEKKANKAFISQKLPAPENEFKQISLKQLQQYYTHTGKYLLQQRLQIQLPEQQVLSHENEALLMNNLDKYQLDRIFLEKSAKNEDVSDYQQLAQAWGYLPPATMGQQAYQQIEPAMQTLWQKIQPFVSEPPLKSQSVGFEREGLNINADFNLIYPQGLVHYRPASIKEKDLIRAWLAHLLLNRLPADCPKNSIIIGKDKIQQFKPIMGADNDEQLSRLLRWYWQGLLQPLAFFPKSSYAYAEMIYKKKSPEDALKKAHACWENSYLGDSEKEDVYFAQLFHPINPLDRDFMQIALGFWLPLLGHLQEIK